MEQRMTMQARAHSDVVGKKEKEVVGEDGNVKPITDDEVFVFPRAVVDHPIETYMKKVNISYFKVSSFLSAVFYF